MDILQKFAERFTWETGIKVFSYEMQYGWCKLNFPPLNVEELEKVTRFIRNRFTDTEEGAYAYNHPKIEGTGNQRWLCLIADEKRVKKAMDKLPNFKR